MCSVGAHPAHFWEINENRESPNEKAVTNLVTESYSQRNLDIKGIDATYYSRDILYMSSNDDCYTFTEAPGAILRCIIGRGRSSIGFLRKLERFASFESPLLETKGPTSSSCLPM